LYFTPAPQLTEHAPKLDQADQSPSTLHGTIKHFFVMVLVPWQSSPPCFGTGLEQFLERICKPALHVVEHGVQEDQVDQPPLTEKRDMVISNIRKNLATCQQVNPFINVYLEFQLEQADCEQCPKHSLPHSDISLHVFCTMV
jgi:hypothetical protein